MTPALRMAEAERRSRVEPGSEAWAARAADVTTADLMVVMGRVAGPFGIKGWIKVQCYTESIDNLLDYPVWWLGHSAGWNEGKVEEGTVHGRSLIAKLEGCDDREAAARLKGLDVAIPRGVLPASGQGEYYWSELIGLEVANRDGMALGRVAGLLETGANQVLVVQGERERLIPFVEPVIVLVDVAGGRLTVDWGTDF
jgi:16S rRNA processing protein RimM